MRSRVAWLRTFVHIKTLTVRKNHKIQRLICYEHLISLVHMTAGKNEVKNNFYYRNYKDSNLQLIVYTPPRLKRASLSLSLFTLWLNSRSFLNFQNSFFFRLAKGKWWARQWSILIFVLVLRSVEDEIWTVPKYTRMKAVWKIAATDSTAGKMYKFGLFLEIYARCAPCLHSTDWSWLHLHVFSRKDACQQLLLACL